MSKQGPPGGKIAVHAAPGKQPHPKPQQQKPLVNGSSNSSGGKARIATHGGLLTWLAVAAALTAVALAVGLRVLGGSAMFEEVVKATCEAHVQHGKAVARGEEPAPFLAGTTVLRAAWNATHTPSYKRVVNPARGIYPK